MNNEKIILNNEILNLNDQINNLKVNKNTNLSSINPGEIILYIQFRTIHEDIDFAIPSKNTNIFPDLENQLYEHYPDYAETNNYFTCNGNEIQRNKSLEDNNINNSDKIILNKY